MKFWVWIHEKSNLSFDGNTPQTITGVLNYPSRSFAIHITYVETYKIICSSKNGHLAYTISHLEHDNLAQQIDAKLQSYVQCVNKLLGESA